MIRIRCGTLIRSGRRFPIWAELPARITAACPRCLSEVPGWKVCSTEAQADQFITQQLAKHTCPEVDDGAEALAGVGYVAQAR